MKKSIFILAALLTATFANAQITLEATVSILPNCSTIIVNEESKYEYFDYGYILFRGESDNNYTKVDLYDIDGSVYKSINLPANIYDREVYLVCKNIFTTDNKVTFLIIVNKKLLCYNEDGQKVFDFGEIGEDEYKAQFGVRMINGEYKLVVLLRRHDESYPMYIYSLPGNGEAQAVSTPSSPKRSARKISRDGQVLVETENITYTLQGQEVK